MNRTPDAMSRLAAARPASLTPDHDAERRRRDISGALVETPQRRRIAHRRTSRRLGYGLGVVAVGTAAALAVVSTSGGSSSPSGGAARFKPSEVLLAAAQKAEAAPMGKYWFNDQVEAQTYVVKDGYTISATGNEFFKWTAAKEGGGDLFYGRDLPARFLTAADKAAWRRAGSPRSFRVWANDHWDDVTMKSGPWQADRPGDGGRFPFPGFDKGRMVPTSCAPSTGGTDCSKPVGYGATFRDLQNLPTDPKQLAARFLQPPATKKAGALKTVSGENNAQRLLRVAQSLQDAPLPPKLRAAMMRMLPSLPGVYQIGQVTDPLGRPGFAMAADWPSAGSTDHDYGSRTELIFSPNGEYLGSRDVLTRPGGDYRTQKPGMTIFYWASRTSGWTDTKPSPPTKLPY